MSQPARRTTALVALLALLLPAAALAGEPGSAGLLSLRLGVGARSGAMGETGVAHAFDGSAIYWNPANLAYTEGSQLTLQHMEYFGAFRQESLAAAHQTEMGTFGLLFSGFYSEELQRTSSEPAGVSQGTFQPYQLAVGLGWGYQLSELAIGFTGKFLYERIDVYDGSRFAFDVGVTHKARIEGLVLAAAAQNYGQDFELDVEGGGQSYELPFLLRMGGSYVPHIESLPSLQRLQLAAELMVPNDGNGRLHAGAEYRIHDSFALRGGQRFAYETWGPTFGFGIARGALAVDYAFMDSRNEIDDTHRISLRIGNR